MPRAGTIAYGGEFAPASGDNTAPIASDFNIKNGCRVVADATTRKAIDPRLLTAAGALVVQTDTRATWQYLGGDPTDDANWQLESGDASAVAYTATTPADWTSGTFPVAPTTVQAAIDELAYGSRLYNVVLEGVASHSAGDTWTELVAIPRTPADSYTSCVPVLENGLPGLILVQSSVNDDNQLSLTFWALADIVGPQQVTLNVAVMTVKFA